MAINREDIGKLDFSDVATGRRLKPVHPGTVLTEDFIKAHGITRYRVAKAMGVPQRRVDEICAGNRSVSADTALRLERVFSVEAQFWLNLQASYDLGIASRNKARIEREAQPLASVM